jgi:hypothetical protein
VGRLTVAAHQSSYDTPSSTSDTRRDRDRMRNVPTSDTNGREPTDRKDERGFRKLHCDHVLQANHGCDFDFLRGRAAVVGDPVTYL